MICAPLIHILRSQSDNLHYNNRPTWQHKLQIYISHDPHIVPKICWFAQCASEADENSSAQISTWWWYKMKSQPPQKALKSISRGTWMFKSEYLAYMAKRISSTTAFQNQRNRNSSSSQVQVWMMGTFSMVFICEKCVSFFRYK